MPGEDFPADWRQLPLAQTSLPGRRGFDDGDWIEAPYITTSGIRLIQTGNVGVDEFLDKPDSKKFISARSFTQLGCKWVHPGDILICRLADPIGRACIVPDQVGDSVTAVDCTIYRTEPKTADTGYMLHRLNSAQCLKEASDIAGGSTRRRISRSNLGAMVVPLPPLPEQRRIAEILDTLNQAICKTEQVLAKLQQMKQGLLHDLLTRGIDHNGELRDPDRHPAQFKDSPLGRIPKAWDLRTVGSVSTLQRGMDLPIQDRRRGSVPVYGSNGIDGWHDKSPLKGPGVITGRSGSIGEVRYCDGPFWPLNTTLYVKHFHGNDPEWVRLLLSSLRLWRFSAATSVPSLNRNFVHPEPVAVPPVHEQQRIHLIAQRAEERADLEQKGLSKLRTLKLGLMDDLLTGRVRVPVAEDAG